MALRSSAGRSRSSDSLLGSCFSPEMKIPSELADMGAGDALLRLRLEGAMVGSSVQI